MITIIRRRLLSILLSCSLLLTPIYAADPVLDSGSFELTEVGGTHTLPMSIEVESLHFSVTLPTELPVFIDVNGNVMTADSTSVINNSNKDIQVSDITITPMNGWSLKPYDGTLNDNEFGVMINANKSGNGTLTWGNFRVPEGLESPISYDVKLKQGVNGIAKIDVANITMTVNWFERVEGQVCTGDELYDGSTMISMGDTYRLEAPTTYSMRSTPTWSSSDEDIATIDEEGYVTPIKPGRATMSYGTAEVPIHVYGTPIEGSKNNVNVTDSNLVIPGHYFRDGVWYTITSISKQGFQQSSLTSVVIPDTVTSIGYRAFSQCSSMTSVTLPESVTYISEEAFSNCSSLTSVTIPGSVITIGDSAFNNCSSLNSVIIPECVTSIGGYAFNECTSLTSIIIPRSVVSIGVRAFCGCTNLKTVKIYGKLTEMSGTFRLCSSLEDLSLPKTIQSIGAGVFDYVTEPFNVHFEGAAVEWSAISVDASNTILSSCPKFYEVSY